MYRFNTKQWFLVGYTCNEINKLHQLHHFIFSIKFCEIFQGFIKKNSRAFPRFPGISRALKIFQGFPGFPGPVRTLACIRSLQSQQEARLKIKLRFGIGVSNDIFCFDWTVFICLYLKI